MSCLRLRSTLYNLSMATPILASKLYIPPPPSKVVVRTRLVEQLTTGTCSHYHAGGSRTVPCPVSCSGSIVRNPCRGLALYSIRNCRISQSGDGTETFAGRCCCIGESRTETQVQSNSMVESSVAIRVVTVVSEHGPVELLATSPEQPLDERLFLAEQGTPAQAWQSV
jgi:hypothetical protein